MLEAENLVKQFEKNEKKHKKVLFSAVDHVSIVWTGILRLYRIITHPIGVQELFDMLIIKCPLCMLGILDQFLL